MTETFVGDDINEDELEVEDELEDDDDELDFEDDSDDDSVEDDDESDIHGLYQRESGEAQPSKAGEFAITFESVPKMQRQAPAGRSAFPWETALDVIRQDRGNSARFLSFTDNGSNNPRTQSQAKGQNVRNRLLEMVPNEHWEIKVRERNGIWGVYATYQGLLTSEQMKVRDDKRIARAASIKAGRNKPSE